MIDSGRLPQGTLHRADSTASSAVSPAAADASSPSACEHQPQQVRAAETRLLFENANTGAGVTVVVATLLAYAQRDDAARGVLAAWLLYMLAVCTARFIIAHRYWRAVDNASNSAGWNTAFVTGTALSAIGWGLGAFTLYSDALPSHEFLVVFVIGGVMLGSASILAARPEAFLVFLLPTGFLTAIRLAILGDEEHLLMGVLAAVFTVVTVITTWRFHLTIESAFKLRFANQQLIESLQKAKDDADALNRELELRVRDRTAKLREADQRKDEFLATLAHELRNPLAPIRFALEALKSDGLSPPATHARDVIERQMRQLVRLVDDLLDVSRITANKIQLRREPLDLGRLMTTAVESIAPLGTPAGHTMDVQLPVAPICVDGDGARLVQVFANVLNNAVKFTPRGGHIRFTAKQEADSAVVRIRDTGQGITSDVLPHVFDMFHQAEPVLERSTGGLGIGLTLARRLVEMHEGQITIRSEGLGHGTEVEIRLPVTSRIPDTVPAEPPQRATRRTLRVLIVEDNVDAAEMLHVAVSSLGHIPQLAHDGETALRAASESVPDVIFLDIGLPVMNGYEVARALRALPHFGHVHIAAVTGWGQDEDRRKAREAGCDSHFTKPLSPSMLEELLSRIAEREADDPRADATPRTRHGDSGGF